MLQKLQQPCVADVVKEAPNQFFERADSTLPPVTASLVLSQVWPVQIRLVHSLALYQMRALWKEIPVSL